MNRYLQSIPPDLLFISGLITALLLLSTLIVRILEKYSAVRLTEIKLRIRSWWIMAFIFLLATAIAKEISFIAFALLSFTALRELYSILDFRSSDRRTMFWAYASIPVQFYLAYIGWYGAFIIFIPVVLFLWIPFRLALTGDMKGNLHSMSVLQWTLMLSVFSISHLAYLLSLPSLEGFEAGGRALLLYLVFLTEINDVLQFIWGKLTGKHPIIPRVSPNKTWEGFIGGFVCTILIGCSLSFLTPFTIPQVILVSAMIAFSGFAGDIVVSSIKRDVGIKDMGTAIPGHGGILDRIDSLAYTAPVFFHLVYYIAY